MKAAKGQIGRAKLDHEWMVYQCECIGPREEWRQRRKRNEEHRERHDGGRLDEVVAPLGGLSEDDYITFLFSFCTAHTQCRRVNVWEDESVVRSHCALGRSFASRLPMKRRLADAAARHPRRTS